MRDHDHDHTAAFAEAFFMANLLFVGVFHLALWVLWLTRRDRVSPIARDHLKQALAGSAFTTLLFLALNIGIMLTTGYHSVGGLLTLEIYYMFIVPLFMLIGILGFKKAITREEYRYPVFARLLNIETAANPA
ncbi:MAG TPA: hypothetical protein ENK26_14265 [Gammaproteobacteria bacterium]|nr:hypothetical protein [Gammaproteobacteria bacterium]